MADLKRRGILLVNLGTPEAPTKEGVKAFLSEFLHDKRVVDLSRWLWCPLLHGIILPIRAPKVAKLYQQIWMAEGSPLMVYSQQQRDQLQALRDEPVAIGMTYGSPSIQSAVQSLIAQQVEEIVVLPLYPQYSGSTTGAVFDAVCRALMNERVIPTVRFIRDYHDHDLFIEALAQSVRASWEQHGKGDYLLCSYHGIPKRYADEGDIYPTQCERTTKLLQEKLGLSDEQIGMSYQSRFGREEWLQPYTDKTLHQLAKRGIEKLDIITPAFSVDCLETLEEIAEGGKSQFLKAGGKSFQYIPCLNATAHHISMIDCLIGKI